MLVSCVMALTDASYARMHPSQLPLNRGSPAVDITV
jgi:hypothetical protein